MKVPYAGPRLQEHSNGFDRRSTARARCMSEMCLIDKEERDNA